MSNHDRLTGATSALAKILSEASGFDLHELDQQSTFLELGFDSLFLIQFSQKIKNQMKVKVSFRQLIEELPSIDALVQYLSVHAPDEVLLQTTKPAEVNPVVSATEAVPSDAPAVAVDAPALPQFSVPTETSVGEKCSNQASSPFSTALMPGIDGSASPISRAGLEQVIMQQNQLMALQLQMLCASKPLAVTEATQPAASPPVGTNSLRPVSAVPARIAGAEDAQKPAQADPTPHGVPRNQAKGEPQAEPQQKKLFERFGPYKPVRREQGGLNAPQQASLDEFVARFTAKTVRSRAHAQLHRRHFADPRGVAGYRRIWKSIVYQIAVERSAGSKLWDIDGNEYIDIAMGFGLNLFGQSPPFITEALHRQLDLGVEVGPQSPLAGEVAQLLCDFSRKERATFCNTGSEAVMAAMRLARTVTGKSKIVFFNKDYHGNFDEVLLRSNPSGGQLRTSPAAPGIPQTLADNAIVLNYGAAESLRVIEEYADEIAAVLVEPVQSADPFNQPREFLHEIRRITRERNIAMIMDEVITGFRAGQGGAQEYFDVWADMATYGKILGGGLPIGALAGSAEYMDALDGGTWRYEDNSEPEADMTFFAGTFVRHPLVMVAAYQVLMKVKEEGPELQKRLTDQTRYLADTLNRFFEENLFPIRVAQFTSLFRFMFPPDLEYADLLYFHLLDRGIFTRGWADNCFLSTEHSAEDVEKIIAAVKDSCLEIRQGGFMPKPVASATCDVAGTASKEVVEQSGNGDEVGTRFPLTQTQQEILLTSKHSPEAAYANNEPFTLRLTGTLNVPQLQSAVDTVLSRHPILHVRIDEAGEYQELRPPQRFEMVHRDLRQLPADARAAEITATTIRFASTVFDVYHDPLVRIELLRLTDNDHLLIIDGHHIVTDGWSWNVMLKEMGQVYSALQAGTEIHLPQPGSFREYVLSTPQRDEDAEVALRYWLDKYSTIPAPLDLPLDNPRPPRQTYAANSVIHDFSESTYRALKQIAANNNVSLFTAGLAAYQLLVSRLSGQPDVVIGMRTAGQSILDNQDLVGLCMNVLPIRVQLSPESTFRELLRSVHHEVLEAFEHQDCTLGKIVRNLKVPRQSNRMPLTDLHFNLDKDSTDIRFSGLKAEVGMTVKRAINHDLFFNLNETPTGLKLYWDYNRDLFDESTVMRWIEHYETILESLASDANQKLSDVSILSERQLKTTAITWNATEREYPRDKSVIDLFEEQAERTPQARAVTFGASSLDYTTLNTKANQLARQLQSQGVTNGTFVGILLERSEQMVIATLAALKAGATYVPMDPEFPTDRLKLMVQDSGLDCLLTQSSLTSRDIAPHATQILVDGHATNIASQSGNNLRLPIANEQAAYVIYTSGSTGVPKGVQIPHRALTNFLCSMLHEPGLNSSDTLAGVTTLSFDIAALELYLPLICGAHLLVVTQSDSTDGKRLADLLSTHHVTVLQATPATWRLMIESGWQGKPDLKILCGGEAMPSSLANQLVHSGSEVWNMYGPTETTVWSTVKRIADPGQRVTIGRPIANTQVYILDSSHRSVPVGVLGDLYIGGDGLATGYLNRQELTAERFANISVNGLSPVRLYNTGDQARFLPDGEIEFVGRSDFQVKISGYRIELGEIESVLNRHPNIRQSVATVFEDASGHKRLVGYVRTNEGEKPYAVIRDYLKENLPNYMVPTTLEFLDEFPLTPNGKVDRKLLPAPSSDRPELAVGYVAERTPVEEQIAAIFREVVNIDRVGVHDNFFELGGHSLSATKVVARLGQLFSVPLTIADVFESPTVAELATQIGQSQQSLSQNSLSDMPISRARRETRQVLR